MIYHVINGDGLAGSFPLEGEIIVCREALIDGNLKAKNLTELWKVRAEFVKNNYGADDYFEKVKDEFDKLKNLKPTDEVNLWFGNEAFCQVNMSFVLWLIWDKKPTFYRVFPDSDKWDCSFGNIEKCFESRQKMSWDEVRFGTSLWQAFQAKEHEKLWHLGSIVSGEFPKYKKYDQVCKALMEIDSKPKEILLEITKNGETDFNKIFLQFKEKAGIYGFGDLQIRRILETI